MRPNRRERIFILTGLVILLGLGVYFLLINPLASRRDHYRTLKARLEANLSEIQALVGEYRGLAAESRKRENLIQARGSAFSPFSYLETLARKAELGGHIESITPLASSGEEGQNLAEFEVRLSGIRLLELVRFLYRIENSDKVLYVINLNIRPRYLSPDQLDVTLRVATPPSSA